MIGCRMLSRRFVRRQVAVIATGGNTRRIGGQGGERDHLR